MSTGVNGHLITLTDAEDYQALRDGGPSTLRAASTVLMERLAWMRQAGLTFGGLRDMYQVLGYKRVLSTADFRDRYERGGIAGRIVDAMPDATWRGDMQLAENPDIQKDTPFEQAWKDLARRLQIRERFLRVDKLARLSTFAVLLIGTKQQGDLSTELPKGQPDDLIYLQAYSGGGSSWSNTPNRNVVSLGADCTISEYETDVTSERFGLPKSYQLRRTEVASVDLQRPVHWSRIIHIAEGMLFDDVFGLPALERIWNLLDDLDKVTGGGSEAFWLRANQGLHLNIDKDAQLANEKDTITALQNQAEEYANQMTRMIRTRGVDVKTLGSDVANFANQADSVLTQIAGAMKMPKRILTGSEMGELASSQDRDNWKDQIDGRQTQYAGPIIVRQTADRLIAYGYLPIPSKGPDAYEVIWPHTQTMTQQERSAGASTWATVNQHMGETVFTNAEIREHWFSFGPLDPADIKPVGAPVRTTVDTTEAAVKALEQRTAEDDELVRVLMAAIKAGNTEVIDRIIGVRRT